MNASGKVGIVQTAIQAVSAFGAEFVFFKAFAAAAAAVTLSVPVNAFRTSTVLAALASAFVKTTIRAKTAVVA